MDRLGADQKRVLKIHTNLLTPIVSPLRLRKRTKMKRKTAPIPERKPARVFMAGNSQTVRLQEFRFNTDRVAIRREGGNVVLSTPCEDWADYVERAPRVAMTSWLRWTICAAIRYPLEERT